MYFSGRGVGLGFGASCCFAMASPRARRLHFLLKVIAIWMPLVAELSLQVLFFPGPYPLLHLLLQVVAGTLSPPIGLNLMTFQVPREFRDMQSQSSRPQLQSIG